MLGHIFYFFGLFVILSITTRIGTYKKFVRITEFIKAFKKVTGKKPNQKDHKPPTDFDYLTSTLSLLMIEFLWYFVGILSGNWIIFLSMLVLNFVSNKILNVLHTTLRVVGGIFLNVVNLLIILFLIVNHFHLHLDIFTLLFG
jgi:hypothetical protein